MNEVLDYLVNLALEEADVRIEDYIDVDYFANLKASTEISVNEIQKLSNVESSDEEIYDEISFDEEQYYALTESITDIFSELTIEEYEGFETLAEDDEDIREMLTMVENGFEEYDESSQVSYEVATSNVVKLSAAVMTIGSILSGQQVCQAAIIAIKGAFNSMVATLKAFFVPTSVKAVIVTAAILVLTTVVIVNWNKIKPVFNQIVNVFVDNAKKLATNVRSVFNSIYKNAIKSSVDDAVFDDEIKNNMDRYALSKTIIANLLKEFTGFNIYDSNDYNKTVYLGLTEDKYYKIAEDNNGICFRVTDGRWYELASKHTTVGLWLINRAFLNYVIYKRWEIVLVSDPSVHYNLITQQKLSSRMYASELEYLCKYHGATWHSEVHYWRIDKAW